MWKSTLKVGMILGLGALPLAANIFDISNVTIDYGASSPVIAPFGPEGCPPYICTNNGSSQYWPDGFPIRNIFGAGEQTAEGTYDTIFRSPGTDVVYFEYTGSTPLNGTFDLNVTGSAGDRAYTSFSLLSSALANGSYTSLFTNTPTNGAVSGTVSLTGAGPYFEYQFASNNDYNSGARIFGVSLTATPEPGFYGFLALGLSGLVIVVNRRRKIARP